MQGFELMASQLRGKLTEGGSRYFHHGETHNNFMIGWMNLGIIIQI